MAATPRSYRWAGWRGPVVFGSACALLAAAFAFGIITQNSVRPASSKREYPLFGVSVSSHNWLARTTRQFGHLPVIGTYYAGLPAANAWRTGPEAVSNSTVVVTFAVSPARILSGADNGALTRFFDEAPARRTIYYSYDPEPEAAIREQRFTLSSYKAAWAVVVKLAREAHHSSLKPTLILSGSDLAKDSGVNWKDYLPGSHIVSTLAWDAYPAGTLAGHDPQLTPPASFMGPAVTASRQAGFQFGFAAFGLATATGRPNWLREVANYLMSQGALFGILSDSPSMPKMKLTDAASIATWRAVVSRSGTGDLLPILALVPPTARAVCGRPILNSPFTYDAKAGSYESGTAGLPTYGTPRSDFPQDKHGDIIGTTTKVIDYHSYQLNPDTVYYLLPGTHVGSFQAETGDAFVGGRADGRTTVLSGDYSQNEGWSIDSNESEGDAANVTIEYLTVEKYTPYQNAAAINQDSNTGWTIRYNTVTLNVPGAGIIAGTDNVIEDNCLTLNGQYGFQSMRVDAWGADSLTRGPYDVTVEDNEISYNDTCDYEGLLDNPEVGWKNYDPVPSADRNSNCGSVSPDGDEGGFKLWQTDGVTIKDNYIHNNWGPGGWVDTGNANTTFTGNTITENEGEAIIEEISYNFSITRNYIADNDWIDGLGNSRFPQPAVYISNSGSDTALGAVSACPETSCTHQGAYPEQSIISDNALIDNGGGIFLWENSSRYCSDGWDGECTLVDGGPRSPFTLSSCAKNMPTATVSTTTYVGNTTGTPAEDWWDGCQWETANVSITHNTIDFNPAHIIVNGKRVCNHTDWPDCGANGIFSQYGSPNGEPPWVIATQLTFHQDDVWADNTYDGPSQFFAWDQGNQFTVTWRDWTGSPVSGDECGSAQEHRSGECIGPFGQDAGSAYNRRTG